jgi:hypothetical protein
MYLSGTSLLPYWQEYLAADYSAISRASWYNSSKAKIGVKMYVNGALMTGGTARPALPLLFGCKFVDRGLAQRRNRRRQS